MKKGLPPDRTSRKIVGDPKPRNLLVLGRHPKVPGLEPGCADRTSQGTLYPVVGESAGAASVFLLPNGPAEIEMASAATGKPTMISIT